MAGLILWCWIALTVRSSLAVTIVAHMTNTPGAVRWALEQGANGVELDLQFVDDQPDRFQHSIDFEPCDCTCLCPFGQVCAEGNVCGALIDETNRHCTASSNITSMMQTLSDPDVIDRLAVIYIDNKLSKSMVDLQGAGATVVRLLNQYVLDRGFAGQVILDANKIEFGDYIIGAMREALYTRHFHKFFYTYGSERGNDEEVWSALTQLQSDNIVYLTGITVCLPLKYVDEVRFNAGPARAYATVGIWTLDRASSMNQYLDAGAGLILTNEPAVAARVLAERNQVVALPGSALLPKSVPRPVFAEWQCECSYQKGGCVISRPPPPGSLCRCSFKGVWTCSGRNVVCTPTHSHWLHLCLRPEDSQQACLAGGGDCGGYSEWIELSRRR